MQKIIRLILIIALLTPLTIAQALPPDGTAPTAMPFDFDYTQRFDANNLEMIVTNRGSFARNIADNGTSGLWYPNGSQKSVIYAAGMWVGALIDDEIHVTVAEYSYEYAPGTYGATDGPQFRVYKINRGDTMADDYLNWPFDQGAPYVDENHNGRYDPGEPPQVLGDQTLFCVYHDGDPEYHTNDAGSTPPLGIEVQQTVFGFSEWEFLANTVFIKYKIINKGENELEDAWIQIWSDPDLGRGGDDLVGCDVDRGMGYCYNATNQDNVYGTNPPAVGFLQVQDPITAHSYRTVTLPDGTVLEDVRFLGLGSFMKYTGGSDPHQPEESYAYMQGLNPEFSPIIDPTTGEVTTFVNPGDPVVGSGWLDTYGADRRMSQASGPFDLPPWEDTNNDGEADLGEPGVQELVVAVIVGQGSDRLSSITALRYHADFAHYAYWHNFSESVFSPAIDPVPSVSTMAGDQDVILYWDDQAETARDTLFQFEGYNVYQLDGPNDPDPTRIATFDINNNMGTIVQRQLLNGFWSDQVVQQGSDSGISRSIRIDHDFLRDEPLYNNHTYYFAVTAYYYNPDPDAPIRAVEDDYQQTVVTVTPRVRASDFEQPLAYGDTLAVIHASGVSDARVIVQVIDPTQVTGDSYEIFGEEITDGELCGYDVDWEDDDIVYVPKTCTVWQVRNLDSGEIVVPYQTTTSAEQTDQPIFDGLQVRVIDYPVKFNTDEFREVMSMGQPVPVADDPDGVWHSPNRENSPFGRYFVSAGGAPGTIFRLERYIWHAVPRDFEIRFVEATYDSANGWQGADAGWALFAFNTNTIRRVPFELWDIGAGTPDDPADDRRMIPFILSNQGTPTYDPPWRLNTNPTDAFFGEYPESDWIYWMDADTTSGGYQAFHEWCEAHGEGFLDEDGETDTFVDFHDLGFVYPVGRFVICDYSLDDAYQHTLPAGTHIRLVTSKRFAAEDRYTFDTVRSGMDDAATSAVLKDIKAVPNPFFLYSRNQFEAIQQRVQFTHLPAQCTIRIFNLAGQRVRKLEKNDTTQSTCDWDLTNDGGRTVASGLYIWHLDSEYGTKEGKLAVFTD